MRWTDRTARRARPTRLRRARARARRSSRRCGTAAARRARRRRHAPLAPVASAAARGWTRRLPMGEHRRLRRSGRAAREEQRREVVDGSRSTIGDGSAATRSSKVTAPGIWCPAVAMTVWMLGTFARSTSPQLARPVGPTMTATVSTAASSRSSSGAGLAGLSGTTTAPMPSTARYDITNGGLFAHITATRSPGPMP